MSDFIKDLKRGHEKLLAILLEAQSLGLGKDSARAKLLEGKKLLMEHLRKEDIRLYPDLKRVTANAPSEAKIVDDFSGEMKVISVEIIDFFKKVEKAEINIEYAKELGRVISGLKKRIRREEMMLYPIYEKHTKKS